jgi:hypothetical protein
MKLIEGAHLETPVLGGIAMTNDRDRTYVDDTVDFDSIFSDNPTHVREDDEVDLVADEDREWRLWRETMSN